MGRQRSVPRKSTGRTGQPHAIAKSPTPGLNGPMRPLVERVPSGKKTTFAPAAISRLQQARAWRSSRERSIGITLPSRNAIPRRQGEAK